MLIKPWNESTNPRHEIEVQNEASAVIPEVEINWSEKSIERPEYMVIVPQSLRIIVELFNYSNVGTIRVFSQPLALEDAPDEDLDDYDEDTQLYKSMNKSVLFQSSEFPIFRLQTKEGDVLAVIVPFFLNSIAYNVLARALRDNISVSRSWVTLTPTSLNNGQSLNRLEGEDVSSKLYQQIPIESYSQVPRLEPPHSITGIVGALNSVLYPETPFLSLVLNADGQIGFERTDSDSIVDAAYVLAELIHADDSYVKAVSKAIRKFNSTNNSGMYL